MLPNKQTKRNLAILLIAMAMLAVTALAWATHKPGHNPGGGGDPSLPGVIYFHADWVLHTMNPDGSNKTPLTTQIGHANRWGIPSHDLHGGRRWFLQLGIIDDEFYPDDKPRLELFAASDDGLMVVQLTDDPTLAPLDYTNVSPVAWAPGDTEVSWLAKRWNEETDTYVEQGIYVAQIGFDLIIAGDIGIIPNSVGILVPGDLIRGHDWAPDGKNIVYGVAGSGLSIEDLVEPSESYPLTSDGRNPRWSPDGQKIAFLSESLNTIDPDGSNRTTIVTLRKRVDGIRFPCWSPTGTHLIYQYMKWTRDTSGGPGQGASYSLYRVAADGKGKSDLTNDMKAWVYPVGWRD